MPDPRDQHASFWRTVAERASREGWTLTMALKAAAEQLAGSDLAEPAAALARAVEDGRPASAAMEAAEQFSGVEAAMMRAAESGAPTEVIAGRLADGIEAGDVPAPGTEPQGPELARFFRCFARMISSGIPLLEALQPLQQEVAGAELTEAVAAMRRGVERGRSLSETMGQFPEVFPEEAVFTIEQGEELGVLDEKAFELAEALAAGDLTPLTLETMEEVGPVRRFVNALMLTALEAGASDIHVGPREDGTSRVRFRIDGVLYEFASARETLSADRPEDAEYPEEMPHEEVVNRVKVMAGMDAAEKRMPQDGRIKLRIGGPEGSRPVDVRASTVPLLHGERLTMRVFDRETLRVTFDLDVVIEDEQDRSDIRDLIHQPNGLVLLNGPTGSGKTTTLYAALKEYDRDRLSVLSIEDPVEFEIESVAQMEVNPRIGRTFARLCRAAFRQDPDVVLIGELRDGEVANLAAQCALTGHICLTTLNAETAAGGLRRLVDMGVPDFVVNAAVRGSVSQRLVRRLCPECKESCSPPLYSLPEAEAERLRGRDELTFFEPVGCPECNGTGYKGRMAVWEVLVPGERVRRALLSDADDETLREAAVAEGTRTLLQASLDAAARGLTSVSEAIRIAPRPR